MGNLKWQLGELQKHNKDGSYATQQARKETLSLIAKQLKELGYNQFQLRSLKAKHVNQLVEKWKSQELSNGTLKNRMTHIRWWAGKVNKPHVIPTNDELNIEHRVFVTNETKAVTLTKEHLAKVDDPQIKDSLRMQAAFGLRREESLKFNPEYADKGDKLELKGSWCKGSRSREIPIVTPEQRALVDELKARYGNASLIPSDRQYVDQMNIYKNTVPKTGLGKGHGLRHNYAQNRYKELSGNESPARGGQRQKDMTEEERALDRKIRLQISAELGHAREQITSVYLGS